LRAYVFITTKPGTSEEVIKALEEATQLKGVIHADSIYGRFDAIVVLEAESLEEIAEIVYKVIEKIPNIVHTETAISLFTKK
jgi:DNA-binding Lrp family transcriptional regulator